MIYDNPIVVFINGYNDGVEAIQTTTIIGEHNDHYLVRPFISKMDYWDSEGVRFTVIKQSYTMVHKSRFIRNAEQQFFTHNKQLTLF